MVNVLRALEKYNSQSTLLKCVCVLGSAGEYILPPIKKSLNALNRMLEAYSVGEPIGYGARSVICEILPKDDAEGEPLAAKCVAIKDERDRQVLRHLENEYSVLKQLHDHHENVDGIVDVVKLKKLRRFFRVKSACIIMERIEGQSLAENSDYTFKEKLTIIAHVCDILSQIHSLGWVHGDVKPDNIIVGDRENDVKLIDFGFAAEIGTRLDSVKGTWGFLAPEQAGGKLQPVTDVFSLGGTMYWLLTGEKLPSIVPGEEGGAGFVPQDGFSPIPPARIDPGIPVGLSDMIMDCCSTDLTRRPPLHQVRDALRNLRLRKELGM